MRLTEVMNSGFELNDYLERRGLYADHFSSLEDSQNCIYMSNLTTFNWKTREGQVRINCKDEDKECIEKFVKISALSNGAGDPTRPWSFLVDDTDTLDEVIKALRKDRCLWLHRISHHSEVSYPLLEQGFLSIGFSDFLMNDNFLSDMKNPSLDSNVKWDKFEKENIDRWGGLYRTRHNLWRFICKFKKGDFVLVPSWGVFSVYEITGDVISVGHVSIDNPIMVKGHAIEAGGEGGKYLYFSGGQKIDLGFAIPVNVIEKDIPRSDYAQNELLSRMKIRQTNADITDLQDSVYDAIKRKRENNPINIYSESVEKMSEHLETIISKFVYPDQFERLIKCYFDQIGADETTIPSKREGKGEADGDVVARFDSLKLYVYVQAKHHKDKTGEYAVKQISEYTLQKNEERSENGDDGYSSISWVISSAEEFTQQAIVDAMEKGVKLINGSEFRRMLINAGFANMEKMS